MPRMVIQTLINNCHVFISYRRDDAPIVNELIGALGDEYRCWRDTAMIRGGQVWREEITRAIDTACAMILIVSPYTEHSKEVYAEYFYARGRGVPVIPLLVVECDLPFGLENVNARLWYTGKDQLLKDLREDLIMYQERTLEAELVSDLHIYLRALQFAYLMAVENYTPMAGAGRYRERPIPGRLHAVVMRPEFALRKSSPLLEERKVAEEVRSYDDLIPALHELNQVLVLGEPGIGKTTTLFKFADELQQSVFNDTDAPVPVIVPLREWRGDMSWKELVSRHLGVLAPRYEELLFSQRLHLLLDGLNEIPRDKHRGEKLDVLRQLLDKEVLAVVTCRELDYRDETLKLDLDTTITIHPLDPERVLDFLHRYLTNAQSEKEGVAESEILFWQIAGGEEVKALWEIWHREGGSLNLFFTASKIPEGVARAMSMSETILWHQTVKEPNNLMHLAANPYLLWMFLNIFLLKRVIPHNRGALFDEFVFQLLQREGLTHGEVTNEEGERLMAQLGDFAWGMHRQTTESQESGDEMKLTIPRDEAIQILGTEERLYRAASANLLEDTEPVRFTHQLMQEYFVARRMLDKIDKEHLSAQDFWPSDQWWQPCGWEESIVLAVGISRKQAERVIEWLLPVNPEVAALCIQRSGVRFEDRIRLMFRNMWLSRLADMVHYPEAVARAAIGRALGNLTLQSGKSLDNRLGVGLSEEGIPDMDWIDIPSGQVELKRIEYTFKVQPFQIARYPVTNEQFQAFVSSQDGYSSAQWWKGFERSLTPAIPRWREANVPRDSVSWYEAVAFCRWLTQKCRDLELMEKDDEIRLPTEWEWQQAATGGDPGNKYPWGLEWNASRCNSKEGMINRTSTVGLYPHGIWDHGPLDMAGNVWEWCINKYDNPEDRSSVSFDDSHSWRVLRGGCWFDASNGALCNARNRTWPSSRSYFDGFRCVRTKK